MSAALSINGSNLVPIKEVLGSTGYTRDYIAKLAREGQIVAAQVGRQWYIDVASLENFKAASELEATVRRRHLSHVRRRERELKQEVEKHFDIVTVKHRRAVAQAVLQSVLILVVGFSTGYFVYALSHLNPGVLFVQKAQTVWLAQKLVLPSQSVPKEPIQPAVSTVVLEEVYFSPTHEVVSFGSSSQGVLMLPSVATSAVAVERLFSDPVQVVSLSQTNGEVVLNDGSTTRSLPFVVVPVEVSGYETVVAQNEVSASTR